MAEDVVTPAEAHECGSCGRVTESGQFLSDCHQNPVGFMCATCWNDFWSGP